MNHASYTQITCWIPTEDFDELNERARGFNASIDTIASHLLHKGLEEVTKRRRARLTEKQLKQLAALHRIGFTDRQIATRMGIGLSTVANNKNRALA